MRSEKEKYDRNLNRDVHRNARDERFPESSMTKDSRHDFEEHQQHETNLEELSENVEGTVGSRTTSDSPEDIAGVADIDNGMRRASKRK